MNPTKFHKITAGEQTHYFVTQIGSTMQKLMVIYKKNETTRHSGLSLIKIKKNEGPMKQSWVTTLLSEAFSDITTWKRLDKWFFFY